MIRKFRRTCSRAIRPIRVLSGRVPHLRQDDLALRVVDGPAPRQHELAVEPSLHQSVGIDHPDGILEPVEPGDLEQDRLVKGQAEPGEDSGHFHVRELPVLVAHLVDGRIDQVLGDGKPLGERGEREDGRVEPRDEATQEGPDPSLGPRGIDVAAPDPGLFRWTGQGQGRWLRVVDHDQVGAGRKPPGVFTIRLQVVLAHGLGDDLFLSLQGVVEGLGHPCSG